MSTTEPIRNTIELSRFMDYYKTECANHRNYAMIVLGLYSALRISDILNLKWSDIYDFKGRKIKSAVTVKEQKTGKINNFALNNHIPYIFVKRAYLLMNMYFVSVFIQINQYAVHKPIGL